MAEEIIALCVGHSRSGDNGAVSVDGTSEWTYNSDLAVLVQAELKSLGVKSFIIKKYEGSGYAAAMNWAAGEVKRRGGTLACELHFNAASSPVARGHEWLYYHSSPRGKAVAASLSKAFSEKIGAQNIPSRGIKPKRSGDRGALFLQKTHCPAVICEPFFGSNLKDWDFAVKNKPLVAAAIARGIADNVYAK